MGEQGDLRASSEDDPPTGGGPPWIDPTIQQLIGWRDGDIVVSVPAKSGTTWTMNIVHQLRSGGDADFDDVYEEVPWIEFVPHPNLDREELARGFDQMPDHRRRAFKTHSAPGALPYFAPGDDPDVKYVVVVRNPDEAIASLRPFIASHSDAFLDRWGAPRDALVGPDLESFVEVFTDMGMIDGFFSFVDAWWPLRNNANVHLTHFADLKADHEGSVRRMSEFLELPVTDEQLDAVLEYTSFDWMKANGHKFELRSTSDIPILKSGAMVRRGEVGAASEDGITPAISSSVASIGKGIVTDPAALSWCYDGGPIPR